MLRTADITRHAFIRARRELNISWDRVDGHSLIDHSVTMSFPTVDAERLRAWPRREDFGAQLAGDGDAGFQPAGFDRQSPGPATEGVLASKLMEGRLDQDPAQPRRAGF